MTLSGPVTLRLLPTPYLEVGAGSAAGAGADAPRLAFEGARLELALVKLASGAFRFTDVRLDEAGPDAHAPRPTARSFCPPRLPTRPTRSGPTGSRCGTERSGSSPRAARGSGRSKASNSRATRRRSPGPTTSTAGRPGPGGAPIVFRLASEKAGPRGAPVRVAVEAGPRWPALEFDGDARGSGANGPSARRRGGHHRDGAGRGRADAVAGDRKARGRSRRRDADGRGIPLRTRGAGAARRRIGVARVARRARAAHRRRQGPAGQCRRAAAPQGRGRRAAVAGRCGACPPRLRPRSAAPRTAPRRSACRGRDRHPRRRHAVRAVRRVRGRDRAPRRPPASNSACPARAASRPKAKSRSGAAARFVGARRLFHRGSGRARPLGGPGRPGTRRLGRGARRGAFRGVALRSFGPGRGGGGRRLREELCGSRSGARSCPARSPSPGRSATTPAGSTPTSRADSLDLDTLPSLAGGAVADRRLRPVPVARRQGAQPRPCRRGRDRGRLAGRSRSAGPAPNLTLDRLAIAGLGGAALEATRRGRAGRGRRRPGASTADKLADFAALVSPPRARTLDPDARPAGAPAVAGVDRLRGARRAGVRRARRPSRR